MKFREISKNEFSAFCSTYPRQNFWQTVQMSEFRERNGAKAYYVGVEENNQIIAAVTLIATPLRFSYFAFDAARGMCVDYTNTTLLAFFLQEIEAFARKHKGLFVRFDPYYPVVQRDIDGNIVEGGFDHRDIVEFIKQLGYTHGGYTVGTPSDAEPRWMFVLDLEGKSEEQILQEMAQKTRNQVHTTKRKAIHVRDLSLDEISLFSDMMKHTAQRRHFESRDEQFYYRQYQCLSDFMCLKAAEMHVDEYLQNLYDASKELQEAIQADEQLLLEKPNHKKLQKHLKTMQYEYTENQARIQSVLEMQKEYGNTIVMATSFFVTYGDEIFYLFSAAYDKFLSYNPSVALQWHMIQYGIKHQYKRYNFYGISGIFDKSDNEYGVYQFKRGFNGYVEELMGTFTKSVSWFYPIYQMIKKIIGR